MAPQRSKKGRSLPFRKKGPKSQSVSLTPSNPRKSPPLVQKPSPTKKQAKKKKKKPPPPKQFNSFAAFGGLQMEGRCPTDDSLSAHGAITHGLTGIGKRKPNSIPKKFDPFLHSRRPPSKNDPNICGKDPQFTMHPEREEMIRGDALEMEKEEAFFNKDLAPLDYRLKNVFGLTLRPSNFYF